MSTSVDQARRTARQADSRYYLFVQWTPGGEYTREGLFTQFGEPEVSSSGSTTRLPTGEAVQIAGLQDGFSDTLTRPWIPERDEPLERRALQHRSHAPIRVVRQDVDHYGDPHGDPIELTGVLRGVQRNGYDADSETPREIQLSCAFDSKVR